METIIFSRKILRMTKKKLSTTREQRQRDMNHDNIMLFIVNASLLLTMYLTYAL